MLVSVKPIIFCPSATSPNIQGAAEKPDGRNRGDPVADDSSGDGKS